jgi:hypothetical protein
MDRGSYVVEATSNYTILAEIPGVALDTHLSHKHTHTHTLIQTRELNSGNDFNGFNGL